MREIAFKNGLSIKVSQEIYDIIVEDIKNNKVNAINFFKTFSDQNGLNFLTVNISEISFVK